AREARGLPPQPSQLLGLCVPVSLHSFSCVQASFLGWSHGKGKKPEEGSPKNTDSEEIARGGRVSARSEPGKRILPQFQWLEDAQSDGAQDAALCVTKASPERRRPHLLIAKIREVFRAAFLRSSPFSSIPVGHTCPEKPYNAEKKPAHRFE
ncbi:unnamed protein product, partial [Symbiodinium sp. KB8]